MQAEDKDVCRDKRSAELRAVVSAKAGAQEEGRETGGSW